MQPAEPPETLMTGQEVYIVNRADISSCRYNGYSWVVKSEGGNYRVYDLNIAEGNGHEHMKDGDIGETAFFDRYLAMRKAQEYLDRHKDVIRAENIRAVSTMAYRHGKYELVSFVSTLDNGMMYVRHFYTFDHIINPKSEKEITKVLKGFNEQEDVKESRAAVIDYEPQFKNMYPCHKQACGWDYAEVDYGCLLGGRYDTAYGEGGE
jgi:hypothetical protein